MQNPCWDTSYLLTKPFLWTLTKEFFALNFLKIIRWYCLRLFGRVKMYDVFKLLNHCKHRCDDISTTHIKCLACFNKPLYGYWFIHRIVIIVLFYSLYSTLFGSSDSTNTSNLIGQIITIHYTVPAQNRTVELTQGNCIYIYSYGYDSFVYLFYGLYYEIRLKVCINFQIS